MKVAIIAVLWVIVAILYFEESYSAQLSNPTGKVDVENDEDESINKHISQEALSSIVSFNAGGEHLCIGALTSPNQVVVDASCVIHLSPPDYGGITVMLNVFFTLDYSLTYRIDDILKLNNNAIANQDNLSITIVTLKMHKNRPNFVKPIDGIEIDSKSIIDATMIGMDEKLTYSKYYVPKVRLLDQLLHVRLCIPPNSIPNATYGCILFHDEKLVGIAVSGTITSSGYNNGVLTSYRISYKFDTLYNLKTRYD